MKMSDGDGLRSIGSPYLPLKFGLRIVTLQSVLLGGTFAFHNKANNRFMKFLDSSGV